MSETISLTFSDRGENHAGMQMVGHMVDIGSGFNLEDLISINQKFVDLGYTANTYNLNDIYDELPDSVPNASVLVIKNGLKYFLDKIGSVDQDLLNEMTSFDWDNKYYDTRRSRVLNKQARYNVCFSEFGQDPDYQNKKGTVISYNQASLLGKIRSELPKMLGPKANNLVCEGNRYYNLSKCGIGWHGDSERRKVIAFRLGGTMNLKYNWFKNSKSIGNSLTLKLDNGDFYIMSEKAVGTDWKYRSKYTLRHCAGTDYSKYIKLT